MTCTKCGSEERQGTSKWGANCWREYRANRKVARKPVAQTPASPKPTVADDGPRRKTNTAKAAGAGLDVDPETGEVLEEVPDPRVHQAGWKGLPEGRGGIGWQPGHGPDSGRLCCKHLVCYDAQRPQGALLKGVQPGEEVHARGCWCPTCRPHLFKKMYPKTGNPA